MNTQYKPLSILPILGILLLLAVALSACSTPSQPENQGIAPTITVELPPPSATSTQPPPSPTITSSPTPVPTATTVPTPTLGIGSTRVSDIDGMEQVYVPAGEFLMGTDDPEAKREVEGGRAYPEIPQHTVYLDSFWIDKFEVTNAQYLMCEAAGACEPPHSPGSYTFTNYYRNPDFANYPVIWVNWFKANQYCEWVGRRLPTEAEWEKAARGTDGRKFPWGNEPVDGERANFCDVNCTRTHAFTMFDDGYADTAPVGSYPAGVSPYGAMDMSGNVWEWTSTIVQPYPYDATDGREDPEGIGERVWRGGPWSNGIWWMRSSVRYRSVDWYQWYVLGIRCAADE
jgi:eukaryotic-like serine/threonine-protein kinase